MKKQTNKLAHSGSIVHRQLSINPIPPVLFSLCFLCFLYFSNVQPPKDIRLHDRDIYINLPSLVLESDHNIPRLIDEEVLHAEKRIVAKIHADRKTINLSQQMSLLL